MVWLGWELDLSHAELNPLALIDRPDAQHSPFVNCRRRGPRVRPLRQTERCPGLLGVGDSSSRSIAPLEHALLMIEGAVCLCNRCKPQSDPAGFGMHVNYAAKMRARLARTCGQRWDRPRPSGFLRGMTRLLPPRKSALVRSDAAVLVCRVLAR